MKQLQPYLVSSTPCTGVHGRWSYVTVLTATSKAEACRLAAERDPERFGKDKDYRAPRARLLTYGDPYEV